MTGRTRTLLICLLLALPGSQRLAGQSPPGQPPLPSEEAPAALFASLADEEVDIYVAGSWQADLTAGFALTWNSLSPVMQTTVIPEITSGLRFSQYPDLTISVWLMERWFFDMSVLEGYELNSIVAGYQGREDELVREVRVGNIDIGSFDSPFFPLPAAGIDSLGAWAFLAPENSEHRTALRYDPAQLQSVRFRGMNEIKEEIFDPADYVPDRVFVLPDADVENLVLYLEDDGDFRAADASDAVVDPENGIVYLLAPPQGRVAVYYEVGGIPVVDGSLASEGDLSIIHIPGRWSPFLHRGIYELASAPGAAGELFASLVGGDGEGAEDTRYPLIAEPLPHDAAGLSRMVFITPEEARFDDIRSARRQFPLAEAALDAAAAAGGTIDLYGPGAGTSGAAPPWKLRLEHLSPVSSFSLEEGVLEGSVSVTRNGRDEYRFTVDYDTGELQPLFPVRPDDLIEVRYRTRGGGERGDFLFASRSDFYPTDRLSLGLDAGLRWNLARQAYTTAAGQAPGILAAGGRLAYLNEDPDTGSFSASLEAGLSLKNPDTTGIFRLLGMNDEGLRVPVASGRLYPAASDDANAVPAFTEAARGALYFHDYHLYPAVGSPALQRYDWNLPADQRYPYNSQGEDYRVGPMVAATGSETDGDAIVFTFDLAVGEWVGGRVPLSSGGKPLDLSSSGRIDLLIKPLDDITGFEIYLRAGDLIEDLDGDGVLDEESGPLAPGFSFDPDNIHRPVGRGNDMTDSEDLNGDGRLSHTGGEDAALVWESGDLAATTGFFPDDTSRWQRVSIDLSPSDREKLRSVTAFDIMIKNSSGSPMNDGTVLVADPVFVGTQFVGEASAGTLITSEALETRSGAAEADVTLVEAFPDQAGLFSDGGTQRTALFTWDAAGTWSASTITSAASLGDYRGLRFFMRTPASPAPTAVTVSLTSPDGRGVEASFEPAATDVWVLYTIDLDSRTIDSSAGPPADPVVTVTDRDSLVSYFRISADCPDPSPETGELWLDEVHLSEPLLSLASSLSTSVSCARKGSYLRAGSTEILSDFAFSAGADWDGAYGTGTGDASSHRIDAFSELSTGLFGGSFSGDFAFTAADALFLPAFSAGFRMPFFGGRVFAEQRYGEEHGIDLVSFSGSFGLRVTPRPGAADSVLTLGSSISRPSSLLTQRWEAALELPDVSLSAFTLLGGTDDDGSAESLSGRLGLYGGGILLPRMERTASRSSALDISAEIPVSGGSLLLETGNLASAALPDPGRLNANHRLSALWSFPVPGMESGTASLSLGHAMKAMVASDDITAPPASPLHSFGYDASAFYSGVAPIYRSLFAGPVPVPDDGLLTGSYTPSAGVSLAGSPGSRIINLFIPYRAELTRSVTWDMSFGERSRSGKTAILWSSSAFNLFGRLGRHPLFRWYRTEEIASTASILFLDSGETDVSHLALWDIQLTEKRSLRAENDLVLSFAAGGSFEKADDTFRVSHTSIGREFPGLKLPRPLAGPLPPRLLGDSFLSAGYLSVPGAGERGLTFTAGHESSLELPEKGKLYAHINGIFRRQAFAGSGASVVYYTIGFEAGVGFKLTF